MNAQVTIEADIVSGKLYGFRYRAYNRQGWGGYSDISYILAANEPAQVQTVTVTMSGANVRFDWLAPDDGSQPITGYQIMIMHYD